MSNSFSKEERVAFEQILEGFQDALVLSRNVAVFRTDSVEMERTNNTIWRPQPYIARSYDGLDQSGNFGNYTQLSVPASLGFNKSVPWAMSATELRDALQEQRLGEAAKQKLASDINIAVQNVAALQGTLVVKRTAAASGFDDIAAIDTLMNEQGINGEARYLALSSRDYNNCASNLAARQTMNEMVAKAYRDAYVGRVSSFETFKLDYAYRLPAAAGGGALTINTTAGAGNYYVPKATSVAATGERSNVDNRYQVVTFSATTNVAQGDAFTIAGVEACHHITKQSTGSLKTFRVVQVLSGAAAVISPPIISNQGGSNAEAEYQNVVVTPSATAAITFLNTAAAPVNPFWHRDAIELLPGRLAIPANAGAAVMRASTDQGIELVMQKQYDIKTTTTFFRLDTYFGVCNKQPEMTGIELFSQV